MTVRTRLVLIVAGLSALALIVANAAGLLLIRDYLLDRIDEQLIGISHAVNAPVPRGRLRIGPDQVVYLFRPDGTLDTVRSSAPDETRPAPTPPTRDGLSTAGSWRLIAVPLADGGHLVIGSSLTEVDQTTDRLLLIDAGVMVLVLGLLGVGAAFVVRLGLRPLTRMEHAAAAISAGNLSGRIPAPDPRTEPGRLGLALNAMLARIETEVAARTASEQRLRQFVGDASHELRTPLTSIRGFAELYRRGGAPPGPALDETMARIESEAGRMGVLVDELLTLARLDRQRTLDRRPVDLLEIAADTIRDAHARSPEHPVRLADAFEPATVLGDDHGLRQVAANLVANAQNHTPIKTTITVRVTHGAQLRADDVVARSGPVTLPVGERVAMLEVADDGPGVPAEHAPRIFERWYRADPSRSRANGGGSGLGLAIVAAIVHGHGGWVELRSPRAGGAVFRVVLPADGS